MDKCSVYFGHYQLTCRILLRVMFRAVEYILNESFHTTIAWHFIMECVMKTFLEILNEHFGMNTLALYI